MPGVDRKAYGDAAEVQVAQLLVAFGYRIRDRKFMCRYGEVDVIAEKDGVVCFVEVRMRSHAAWGDPAHTVSHAKQRKVVKAALHYMFQNDLSDRMIRFDVVSVVGRGEDAQLEHIPDAFDAGM